jgi:hypothetical protein
MTTATPGSSTSTLTITIFDGTRTQLKDGISVLYRIFDGNQNPVRVNEIPNSSVRFPDLPFYDNFGDNYRVVVWADGYYTSGFVPVPLSPAHPVELKLMLLPKKNTFDFSEAGWEIVKEDFPFLASGVGDPEGKARYMQLMESRPKSLAALLNIITAMSQIHLSSGTPLSYIKEVIWDDSLAQDRFFAYTDPKLMEEVKSAARLGLFAPEFGSGFFHPGATASWKQVQFGEANVQLTFHEGTSKKIGDTECIVVEPDIDYYKDSAAHGLLEVLPNKFTGGLTNPETVYVLRWIAGQHAGIPDFNPPYMIVGT